MAVGSSLGRKPGLTLLTARLSDTEIRWLKSETDIWDPETDQKAGFADGGMISTVPSVLVLEMFGNVVVWTPV